LELRIQTLEDELKSKVTELTKKLEAVMSEGQIVRKNYEQQI
jgi:hypothetical protein